MKNKIQNVPFLKIESINELWRLNNNHDCAIITSLSDKLIDGSSIQGILSSNLNNWRYKIFSLNGVLNKDNKSIKIKSLFAIDILNKNTLELILDKFRAIEAPYFFLFIPKGSIELKKNTILYSSQENNNCGFLKEKQKYSVLQIIQDSAIELRLDSNLHIILNDISEQSTYPNTGYGIWAMRIAASKINILFNRS